MITGVGDVFIPGGEMSGRHDDGNQELIDAIGYDILPFRAIRNSRAPIVAAVNGICQGGGLIIAMLSDIAVASDRAVSVRRRRSAPGARGRVKALIDSRSHPRLGTGGVPVRRPVVSCR